MNDELTQDQIDEQLEYESYWWSLGELYQIKQKEEKHGKEFTAENSF